MVRLCRLSGLLVFFLLAGSLAAQSRISGRIVDATGLPVENASVMLRNQLTGGSERKNTTDQGRFLFENVAPGGYSVAVSRKGLSDQVLAVSVAAQQDLDMEDIQLSVGWIHEQVTVVSGSRVEELQADSPMKVEAITREQIRDTAYERVSDVLSEVPGVVTRRGSTATVGGEQIQGIDSRQVLVLQDGLPIVGARGIKSGALNLNRQDVGKLERLEVVKGASSSLYGTDAIGGVINMITREPVAPVEGGVSVSGGSLGAVDGRLDFGTRWKNLTLFADIGSHRQDSYGLIPSQPVTVGPYFRRNSGMGKLRYAFTPRVTVGFSANAYHNYETGQNFTETGLALGTNNDSMQAFALTGDFIVDSRTTLQARAYAARYDENTKSDPVGVSGPSFGLANLNERYKRLDATLSRQTGSWNLLQAGFEWAQNSYRGANRLVGDNAGQQVTYNDFWLQDRIQPHRKLAITLGGRYHHHSLFGDYVVPRVGLVFRMNDRWSVRGSFGKGFRAPDLGQLYYRFANPASFYQVIGNPTLQPESSASFGTGVVYRTSRYHLGVSLYRNNVRNLIESVLVGTPTTVDALQALMARYGIPPSFQPLLNRQTFIYQNFNNVYTQGFEVDGSLALTSQLRLQGAYTYLDAVDDGTGLRLSQRHRHQGYVKTDYAHRRWGLHANVRGTFYSQWLLNSAAGTYAYPYRLWDFYLSQRLPKGVQFFGAVDNLANSRDRKLQAAQPSFDRPDYGRTFRVGLRYAFARQE